MSPRLRTACERLRICDVTSTPRDQPLVVVTKLLCHYTHLATVRLPAHATVATTYQLSSGYARRTQVETAKRGYASVSTRVLSLNAKVAELADAPDLGSGDRKVMRVRVPPFAPTDNISMSSRLAAYSWQVD